MTQLSVNVNKIALLRNSRGRNLPNVQKVALDCLAFGADGITVHPRPDERHIRKTDVFSLKEVLGEVELNVEGYPSESFLQMIEQAKPAQCTLVPDPPGALTSTAGWNTVTNKDFLLEVISRLKDAGVRTSIFLETNIEHVYAAKETGTDRIELYTEPYAATYHEQKENTVKAYSEAAKKATELGLGVNAGHDLNLDNLEFFAQNVPDLLEVSIGHALICDALYFGLEETIQRYQNALGKAI